MFTRWLFGRISFVCKQYSFPDVVSTFRACRMYVAIPPLVPVGRRCSNSVYPFSSGGAACSATQVSCRHRISKTSYSSIARSFRYVRPRTFILPIFIPCWTHLCRSLGLLLGFRRDPLVRFNAFTCYTCVRGYVFWVCLPGMLSF